MFYSIALYASLIIFGIGLLYRVSSWFRRDIGIYPGEISPFARVSAAVKGISGTLFSPKIVTLIKVFVIDVLFQGRVLKENVLRWVMHMFIYWGFMLLFLMHALDDLYDRAVLSRRGKAAINQSVNLEALTYQSVLNRYNRFRLR